MLINLLAKPTYVRSDGRISCIISENSTLATLRRVKSTPGDRKPYTNETFLIRSAIPIPEYLGHYCELTAKIQRYHFRSTRVPNEEIRGWNLKLKTIKIIT